MFLYTLLRFSMADSSIYIRITKNYVVFNLISLGGSTNSWLICIEMMKRKKPFFSHSQINYWNGICVSKTNFLSFFLYVLLCENGHFRFIQNTKEKTKLRIHWFTLPQNDKRKIGWNFRNTYKHVLCICCSDSKYFIDELIFHCHWLFEKRRNYFVKNHLQSEKHLGF